MLIVGNFESVAKYTGTEAILAENRTRELTLALASKVAELIGIEEKQATAIPRLTLHQRTAPTTACHVMYEPSVIVVVQGSKEVQIGTDIQTYDSSRYLLISVDLPTVTRVTEASNEE